MYTSNAYYPSPIDGNLYHIYVGLDNGMLAPVHFIRNGDSLVLTFQTQSGYNPNYQPITVLVNGNVSNLMYYQPQGYGQNQLLYCTTNFNNSIELICNTDFQQYQSLNFISGSNQVLLPIPSSHNNILPSSGYIETMPNCLPVNSNSNMPIEVLQGLQALQNGQLADININMNTNGFNLTAEDMNGDRYVIEKYNMNGIQHESRTRIDSRDTKESRLETVKQLRLVHNMTQNQIANYLGVSQKTVSNDLKDLNIK
ncbi:helix-turn-helix transcriptional regulator [Photobacterium damselae]|uniref:helix-turn-helix transcriptional regulator n=1 Tax=Gammaproteobacteria TaxID=1236 RepID=UPI001EDEC82B|nr:MULTISPECIES: helix-turn-helix transcriptional regulator [Gammaproteobacteria]MCG3811191.1 helix-turn-helix transcriptional regulator [Photobacterium damselae]MCG3880688.1 helix-turn-helix transcriptional regulator [Psychrobacter sp. Ps6]